ncbi:MAG: type II toxin-antitoxin system mRNA interferase toxin, RelE/StbE family [Patescibacteria group bacterium]
MNYLIISTNFKKKFKKFRKNEQERINKSLYLLKIDHFNPLLDNHRLKGFMDGYRSVDAGGDLIIVYREVENNVFLVSDLGTHHQLYGK